MQHNPLIHQMLRGMSPHPVRPRNMLKLLTITKASEVDSLTRHGHLRGQALQSSVRHEQRRSQPSVDRTISMHDDLPPRGARSPGSVERRSLLASQPKAPITRVAVKAAFNPLTKQGGWAAAILHDIGGDIETSSEVIFDLCDAASAYDAEILGCIAALDHLRSSGSSDLGQIEVFASQGRVSDLERMRTNGGVPPGKQAFHDMFSDLHSLTTELVARFNATPSQGSSKPLADRATDAARDVVGLPPKQSDKPAGMMRCRTSGCDAVCKARVRPNGEIFAYCWKCKKQWFDKPNDADGGPPSPH